MFLHQVDIEPLTSKAETSGWFFVDEVIASDREIVGNLLLFLLVLLIENIMQYNI